MNEETKMQLISDLELLGVKYDLWNLEIQYTRNLTLEFEKLSFQVKFDIYNEKLKNNY
jgi:hypothetical protein